MTSKIVTEKIIHTRKIKIFEYHLTLRKQDLKVTSEKIRYKNFYNVIELTINSIVTQKVCIVYSEVTTQLEIFQIKMMLELSGAKFVTNLKNSITMHRC